MQNTPSCLPSLLSLSLVLFEVLELVSPPLCSDLEVLLPLSSQPILASQSYLSTPVLRFGFWLASFVLACHMKPMDMRLFKGRARSVMCQIVAIVYWADDLVLLRL